MILKPKFWLTGISSFCDLIHTLFIPYGRCFSKILSFFCSLSLAKLKYKSTAPMPQQNQSFYHNKTIDVFGETYFPETMLTGIPVLFSDSLLVEN